MPHRSDSLDFAALAVDIRAWAAALGFQNVGIAAPDLERGDVPLAESIVFYERGEALRAHCEKLLGEAETRVEKIRVGDDGKAAGAEPLDPE
jgi:exodeoxyribonuclease VII small subunit